MAVKGASPVTFVSETTNPGKQYQIPLNAIVISNGTADCAAWFTATGVGGNDQSAVVPAVLSSLLARGLITPA